MIGLENDRVMSFDEWCLLNGFSRSTGQRIIGAGNGPTFIKLSARRKGVTVAEHKRWARQNTPNEGGGLAPQMIDNNEETQKAILTSMCEHLGSIAESLASIDLQLSQITGTANKGKGSEFSFIRVSDIGD